MTFLVTLRKHAEEMFTHPDQDWFDPNELHDVARFCELYDPDLQHVPLQLQIYDNVEAYDENGEHLGTHVVVPGLFGHAHRLRTGFFDEADDGEDEPDSS